MDRANVGLCPSVGEAPLGGSFNFFFDVAYHKFRLYYELCANMLFNGVCFRKVFIEFKNGFIFY